MAAKDAAPSNPSTTIPRRLVATRSIRCQVRRAGSSAATARCSPSRTAPSRPSRVSTWRSDVTIPATSTLRCATSSTTASAVSPAALVAAARPELRGDGSGRALRYTSPSLPAASVSPWKSRSRPIDRLATSNGSSDRSSAPGSPGRASLVAKRVTKCRQPSSAGSANPMSPEGRNASSQVRIGQDGSVRIRSSSP